MSAASPDAVLPAKTDENIATHVDESLDPDLAVPDVKDTLIDAEQSMLSNVSVREELFPFFSYPSLRLIMICSAGYSSTVWEPGEFHFS
jgi:hypothetical protein